MSAERSAVYCSIAALSRIIVLEVQKGIPVLEVQRVAPVLWAQKGVLCTVLSLHCLGCFSLELLLKMFNMQWQLFFKSLIVPDNDNVFSDCVMFSIIIYTYWSYRFDRKQAYSCKYWTWVGLASDKVYSEQMPQFIQKPVWLKDPFQMLLKVSHNQAHIFYCFSLLLSMCKKISYQYKISRHLN